MKDDDGHRILRLHWTGIVVFGERYHGALAEQLGVSRSLIQACVAGTRRITPDLEKKLAYAVRARLIPRLETAVEGLAALAEGIEAEYGLEPAEPEATSDD